MQRKDPLSPPVRHPSTIPFLPRQFILAIPITVYVGGFAARFVPQQLDRFSKSIDTDPSDLVSKMAWVGSSYASVESNMSDTCVRMFGVMPFYNSSIVRHKEHLPATNHIFLGGATFWKLYSSAGDHTPDLRVLVRHLSEHAGHPLSSVSNPQELFVAIAHAALGMLLLRRSVCGILT